MLYLILSGNASILIVIEAVDVLVCITDSSMSLSEHYLGCLPGDQKLLTYPDVSRL